MKYRKLGTSSLITSVIGLGGLHFGVYLDQKKTTGMVHRAIDLGINFIDTAPQYGQGNSESFIRNSIQGKRDKVFLSTKVGLKPTLTPDGSFGVATVSLTKDNIRSTLETSLKNLGTDHIDLYQVHAFDASTPLDETMSTLQTLKKEGKIRFIGCSNYDPQQLKTVADVVRKEGREPFVSFQVHYNLIERRAEQEVLSLCEKESTGVIVNRALARGILSGQYKVNQPLPENSRAAKSNRVKRWLKDDTLRAVEKLQGFAKERGRTAAQLAIAWLLAKPEVSIVLAGAQNPEHLEDSCRCLDWILSKEDMLQIDQIIDKQGIMANVKENPETFLET